MPQEQLQDARSHARGCVPALRLQCGRAQWLSLATEPATALFGQQPRSMFAEILASVELPPAPLSPPQRGIE
jgi:hypothetical protein